MHDGCLICRIVRYTLKPGDSVRYIAQAEVTLQKEYYDTLPRLMYKPTKLMTVYLPAIVVTVTDEGWTGYLDTEDKQLIGTVEEPISFHSISIAQPSRLHRSRKETTDGNEHSLDLPSKVTYPVPPIEPLCFRSNAHTSSTK